MNIVFVLGFLTGAAVTFAGFLIFGIIVDRTEDEKRRKRIPLPPISSSPIRNDTVSPISVPKDVTYH